VTITVIHGYALIPPIQDIESAIICKSVISNPVEEGFRSGFILYQSDCLYEFEEGLQIPWSSTVLSNRYIIFCIDPKVAR